MTKKLDLPVSADKVASHRCLETWNCRSFREQDIFLQNQFGDKDYLGFESFTLVPFEPNLIKYELLSKKEVSAFSRND